MRTTENFCDRTGRNCYGNTELPMLFEISCMLNKTSNIKQDLDKVLNLVAQYLSADRVFITILNRENSNIFIERGYGISDEAKARGIYRIGEGAIGRVVKSGEPVIIPKILKDTTYLNKTKSRLLTSDRKHISFVCVPVKVEEEISGTLSADLEYDEKKNLEEHARILTIIGGMIAQYVRARQDRLEEVERLREENISLQQELKIKLKSTNMIGNSGRMQELYKLIERVAATNATVLIRGESGVGKELIADAIHYNSPRADNPIIKVNCSALPESLIESELFGHEKGAFTGAERLHKGRFELAEGGTIFLDEIGDLPAQTQVKILRTLQEKEFERVGGSTTLKANVRVVAATNRNLEEAINKGDFREDLFYRLNVFPVYVPPLRERINDIPALVDHFIQKCNKENFTDIKRISSSAIDMLMVYHWPGNIRELENCVERACIMSVDGVIRANNLPPTLQTATSSGTEMKGTLNAILDRVEKQMIVETMLQTRGNMVKAADQLGITERIMGLRIKKFQIDPKRFKL
ncbi:MAG: sigma 54-interacting transcriptional regulator [Bacteroidales bacterium]|nr:sigma 54-interacting transcriptional regulator [Bacteroidales bacterium]MBN2817599.1 sigma 54-interacting transcriptional regulator [Bacteroidales bacterium]